MIVTSDQKPVTRKIFILVSVLWFLVSGGCSNADERLSSESVKPSNDTTIQRSNDLVYLKVERAAASSFDETTDWAPKPDPMAIADGDLETRWSSGYRDGEWIYLDFGRQKTMSRLVVKWEQAYAADFEILTSDDARTWKKLILLKDQTGGTSRIDFARVLARYVKLIGLKRASPEWGISVWELEPFGPKADNPGEVPFEEAFKSIKEKAGTAKKREDLINLIGNRTMPSPGPIHEAEFQRGVNYTSWSADELGAEMSDLSLIYLSRLGVGHIALIPTWYQDGAASEKIYADPKKTSSGKSLTHAINMAHALGLKVMLKPHVDISDEEARSNIIPSGKWFTSYGRFIAHYARFAAKHNVELLCVGTELSNTTILRWKEQWFDIIGRIKKVYKGPLTYAANWDEYETVSFWDGVDYIGMDAYFPLTNKNNPPKEDLVAAWEKRADILETWLKTNNLKKGVIFTEVGYDTVEGSNKQPWRILPTLAKYVESQEEQKDCLDSMLTVLSKRAWFKGLYWWNYFPRPDLGPLGYTLRGKLGEKILSEWFGRLK